MEFLLTALGWLVSIVAVYFGFIVCIMLLCSVIIGLAVFYDDATGKRRIKIKTTRL